MRLMPEIRIRFRAGALLLALLLTLVTGCKPDEDPVYPQLAGHMTHTAVLEPDGTIWCFGEELDHAFETDDWVGAVQVAADWSMTIARFADGSVRVTDSPKGVNPLDVSDWRDVTQVAVGRDYALALKSDGTVLSTYGNDNGKHVAEGTEDWTDIQAISATYTHAIGLKTDGTVVASSIIIPSGQVRDWRDIVAVDTGYALMVGLCSDGTVLTAGETEYGQSGERVGVSDWTGITQVSAGWGVIAGLKEDGTVVFSGNNVGNAEDVQEWNDMIFVLASNHYIFGVRSDGTILGPPEEVISGIRGT